MILCFSIPETIRNSDVCSYMIIKRPLDNPRDVIMKGISFSHDDPVSIFFQNNANVIMLHVNKNPVIQNNISGLGNKTFIPCMVFDPAVSHGKFFPAATPSQAAGTHSEGL